MARKGDFDPKVDQEAVGITEDGLFVFNVWSGEYPRKSTTRETYYVPINNVRPESIQEGQPFNITKSGIILEQMEDGRFVTTVKDTCMVVDDVECNNGEKFIPDSNRENWSPFVSPNGQQIAFMSRIPHASEPADIFITATENGSPVRIPQHDFVVANFVGTTTILQGGDSVLLDWR